MATIVQTEQTYFCLIKIYLEACKQINRGDSQLDTAIQFLLIGHIYL
jgi:hypothetical protein